MGDLEDVLEVVEGEDPRALVEDEERQVVHLHVDLRGEPNPGPFFCQGQVLHDEKFVLEPHVFGFLGHLEAVLALKGVVFVDRLGVEKDSPCDLLAIIADCVEEGLSISEEGNVDFAGADAFVATDYFELLAVVAKGHVVAHQVDFADD